MTRLLLNPVTMNSLQNFLKYVITNPWITLIVSRPIFALGAGFTSPDSPQRLALFAVLSIYTWLCLSNFSTYIQSTGYLASIIASAIVSPPVVYFDRLLHRKWKYEDRHAIFEMGSHKHAKNDAQNPPSASEEDTFGSRYAFGDMVGGTVRGPGTPWEVKGLPPFSSRDPQWVPSPFTFIAWRIAILISCYILNDYVINARAALDPDLMLPSKVPFFTRIREVTREELVTRLTVGISTWVAGYCLLQVLFGIPALIAVGIKPSSVVGWHPVFGSLLDAYTMRGFWG